MKRLNTLILALGFALTIQAQAYMDSDQPNASKMLPAPPDTKSLGFVKVAGLCQRPDTLSLGQVCT